MLEVMSNPSASFFFGSHHWLQHNLPWLAALAMVMGMLREEPDADFDPDDLNG